MKLYASLPGYFLSGRVPDGLNGRLGRDIAHQIDRGTEVGLTYSASRIVCLRLSLGDEARRPREQAVSAE
jgi:hypothetical protein